MKNPSVLIIEPDQQIADCARQALLDSQFQVTLLSEVPDLRVLAGSSPPQLVVMNSSRDVVRAIRAHSSVPLIITRADGDVSDRVECLNAGADDYLVVPYDPRELVARLRAVLRRTTLKLQSQNSTEPREWRFKGLVMQAARRRVLLQDEVVALTTAEYDLLRLLVTAAPRSLSRDHILDHMRGLEWEAVDRSVDILVSRLRDKLRDDPRSPRFIRTVRSVGYQFIGEPETAQSVAPKIQPESNFPSDKRTG